MAFICFYTKFNLVNNEKYVFYVTDLFFYSVQFSFLVYAFVFWFIYLFFFTIHILISNDALSKLMSTIYFSLIFLQILLETPYCHVLRRTPVNGKFPNELSTFVDTNPQLLKLRLQPSKL